MGKDSDIGKVDEEEQFFNEGAMNEFAYDGKQQAVSLDNQITQGFY